MWYTLRRIEKIPGTMTIYMSAEYIPHHGLICPSPLATRLINNAAIGITKK